MDVVTITESRVSRLSLRPAQAEALRAAGRRLASKHTWWGHVPSETEELRERTVIEVEREGEASLYRVRVSDAVGIIVLEGLQILVRPKIPKEHLLYLFSRSRTLPRLDAARGLLAEGVELWELVAEWFLREAERVLRRGLLRDYRETSEDTPALRGRINELSAGRHYYGGVLAAECIADEFDCDSALNRILKAGLSALTRSAVLPRRELRDRAASALRHMDEIGELQESDLRVVVDLRSRYYSDALALARAVLSGVGRSLVAGRGAAWTFLLRTPELVEAGIRQILVEEFGSDVVHKRGLEIGRSLTVNPDLVFTGRSAVADVKYKLAPRTWSEDRADLYQAVAFADAFEARAAGIVRFHTEPGPGLGRLQYSKNVEVTELPWHAWGGLEPEDAGRALVASCRAWLAI